MHYDMLLRRMEDGMSNQVPAGGGDDRDAFTIVRLPHHVREMNRGLYEPVMVSVGPYHMSSASTRAMQARKWPMLRDFLLRGDPDGRAGLLADCLKAARRMEQRARRCYGESLDQAAGGGSDDFVGMLVLDGCFVLQFLLQWSESDARCMQGTSTYVYYDLLLVENQMPYFVLAKLFNLVMGNGNAVDDADQGLLHLISSFFSLREPLGMVPLPPPAPELAGQFAEVYHLLHLQYQRIVMSPERRRIRRLTGLGASLHRIPVSLGSFRRTRANQARTPLAMQCVTVLQEFGVRFKEKPSPASQFDVTFRGGTMEIPRLVINGGTRILLANLFALEQTKDCWNEGTMTGYLVLMNALVNTGADVAVLQRHGILDNMLSNEEEAAAFFNQLGGSALFDPRTHRYARLFKDTNDFCDSRWNRYMAVLKRDHLRTPCSIINLLVAAILLFVSVISAGYVICRYRHSCT
ncbi:unnamed protein product [Triticum turgidum subsp. durum]|uniref:Uncharacterized protein n=1 Tax=Triticum turgidum subsp. durum TaxID=4567 RepID=A0A9R0TUZ5_TRITD|nr:unnamed protein product [Triticum turgidum subsp. durum]